MNPRSLHHYPTGIHWAIAKELCINIIDQGDHAMNHAHAAATHACQICGKSFRATDVMPCGMVHGPLHEYLHSKALNWTKEGYVCLSDLNRLRHEYIEMSMATESQELTILQQQVMDSIEENETLAKNLNAEFESQLSLGDRLADKVASFGGSWKEGVR